MYIAFRNKFSAYPILPISEIYKSFPAFDKRRLVEWQQKGYIEHIKRGFYRFKEQSISEGLIFFTANKIYNPSYISLETVLSIHGIIPEAVFQTTSVSTLNTSEIETVLGNFSYRHIKQEFFFGYRLDSINGLTYTIAHPEKAVLDYLYLNSKVNTVEDFEALRWNRAESSNLDSIKLENYLNLFENKSLNNRFKTLKNYLNA